MTLRVTFEIVPFGEEKNKYPLGVLDIHNGGDVMGLSSYYGQMQYTETTEPRTLSFKDLEHSRQEGFMALTRKVLEVLE